MGTTVEGDLEQVLSSIRCCHQAVAALLFSPSFYQAPHDAWRSESGFPPQVLYPFSDCRFRGCPVNLLPGPIPERAGTGALS